MTINTISTQTQSTDVTTADELRRAQIDYASGISIDVFAQQVVQVNGQVFASPWQKASGSAPDEAIAAQNMAQLFGSHPDPAIGAKWTEAKLAELFGDMAEFFALFHTLRSAQVAAEQIIETPEEA